MSKHLEFLRRSLDREGVRSCAEGVGGAVAATADELVTARAASFGGGGKLERFALRDLSAVRVLPNPHASMFEARFAAGKTARLMYHREATSDFERLQQLLQEWLSGNAVSSGETPVEFAPAPAPSIDAVEPGAVAVMQDDEAARTAWMNRIILALVVVPLVLLYAYSTYSR